MPFIPRPCPGIPIGVLGLSDLVAFSQPLTADNKDLLVSAGNQVAMDAGTHSRVILATFELLVCRFGVKWSRSGRKLIPTRLYTWAGAGGRAWLTGCSGWGLSSRAFRPAPPRPPVCLQPSQDWAWRLRGVQVSMARAWST